MKKIVIKSMFLLSLIFFTACGADDEEPTPELKTYKVTYIASATTPENVINLEYYSKKDEKLITKTGTGSISIEQNLGYLDLIEVSAKIENVEKPGINLKIYIEKTLHKEANDTKAVHFSYFLEY